MEGGAEARVRRAAKAEDVGAAAGGAAASGASKAKEEAKTGWCHDWDCLVPLDTVLYNTLKQTTSMSVLPSMSLKVRLKSR